MKTLCRSVFCSAAILGITVAGTVSDDRDAVLLERIDATNTSIGEAGKRWTAGLTGKSVYTSAQMRSLALPGPYPLSSDFEKKPVLARTASDQNVITDWKSYMSPVEDQGDDPTCWAYAAAGVSECMVHARGSSNIGVDLDEDYIVDTSPGVNPDKSVDAVDFDNGLVFIGDSSARSEQALNSYPNYNGAFWTISSYATSSASRTAIQSALADGPVLSLMYLYEDFMDYESGIYEHVTGGFLGYHVAVIVDYDDDDGYWVCKNSFGTDWGEDGYFRIAYDECIINNYKFSAATVSHDSCYAKIVPALVGDLDDAMSYSWATGEHGYFYGTYTLGGTEDIDAGTAMELLPGATVKLPLNASLRVYGSLLGGGTSGSHATITSSLASPYAGCWYAVKNYGTVDIEYTDVSYGSNGVKTYSGTDETELDYCTVDQFRYYGVHGIYGTLTMRNCTVENSSYSSARGIYAGVAGALVDDCVVRYLTGSSATGIYAYGYTGIDITDNDVYNSSARMQRGIYIDGADYADVLRNDVSDCSVAGIECYNGSGVQIINNTVTDCDVTAAAGIAVNGSDADDVLVMSNHVKAGAASYSAQYGLYCHGGGEMIVRMNTVEDFNHSGIYAASDHGGVDCGASIYDRGNNNIGWNLTGTAVVTGSYWINNGGSAVSAIYNYYGTSSPSSSYFNGSVTWSPYLTSFYSPKPVRPDAPEPGRTAAAPDIGIYPNPLVTTGSVAYCVRPGDGPQVVVTVRLYDRSGNAVRTLEDALRAPGAYACTWDRRDDAGRRVPAGIYSAVTVVGERQCRCRIVVK